MVGIGVYLDDDQTGKNEEFNKQTPLEKFMKAAKEVAQVEHDTKSESGKFHGVCDLKDILGQEFSTKSSLRFIKEPEQKSTSNLLTFEKKVAKNDCPETKKKGKK